MAALALHAPGGPRWDATCTQCHDQDKRRLWGCDGPSSEPTTEIAPCPFCRGGEAECSQCGGHNLIEVWRCPNKLVTEREIATVRAAELMELGVLPDAGGWSDQAHTFVQVAPFCLMKVREWRAYAEAEAQRKAAASAKR